MLSLVIRAGFVLDRGALRAPYDRGEVLPQADHRVSASAVVNRQA